MLKVFYHPQGNYGDILTPYLLRRLWNLPSAHINAPAYADLIGAGSILEKLITAFNLDTPTSPATSSTPTPATTAPPAASTQTPTPTTATPRLSTPTYTLAIWGSGFIAPGPRLTLPPHVQVLAVRGPLSRRRIVGCRAPLGDPGLLASRLIPPQPKKYLLGFIPHYIDRPTPLAQHLQHLPGVHLINIIQSPATFIPEVAQCEYIISSSLHGLITADSFHIPNLHVILSSQVLGDNYKFRDYYASLGKDHHHLDLRPLTPLPHSATSSPTLQATPAASPTSHITSEPPASPTSHATPKSPASPTLSSLTPQFLISTIHSHYAPALHLTQIQDNLISSFEQYFHPHT